jgi:hypothetical protein
MSAHKIALIWIAASLVLAACGSPPTPSPGNSEVYSVAPVFQDYYESHGGLAMLGAAISPELIENGVQVQYFEKVRLEFHPQLPEGSQVILGNLGETEYGPTLCVPPESVASGALYFNATCHSVSPEFRSYFIEHGGVSFFGYPITEMHIEDGGFVQVFERAVIAWNSNRPGDSHFSLAHVGSVACSKAYSRCSPPAHSDTIIPATSIPTPTPAPTDLIDAFYNAHGGARVFGLPLGGRQTGSDGAVEQVFENAILYENPEASEGVSLRPLGLAALGAPEPPAQQLDDPNSAYYDKYGHNVAYGIYTFYMEHGGEAVFGCPISELRVVGDHLVQYFENVILTWRLGLPADQAVQLVNLGEQTAAPQPPSPAPTSSRPQVLMVTAKAVYPVLTEENQPQTLNAWVTDEKGLPVAGATVTFTMNTPGGELKYVINATDSDGLASVTFTLKSYVPGDYMIYYVTASYGGLTASKGGAFTPWNKFAP